MKNQMKGKKGITLIALVITIIVLLILAGVTIATLTGDNGLLSKATNSKEKNEEAGICENIKLAYGEWQIAQHTGTDKTVEEIIENNLKTSYGDSVTKVRVKNEKVTVDMKINNIDKTYIYKSSTGEAYEYKDPFNYGTKTKETLVPGDDISIENENFRVFYNQDGVIKAMPWYNITLPSNLKEELPVQNQFSEKSAFSSTNYWSQNQGWNANAINYSIDINMNNSTNNIQKYIEAYALRLEKLGADMVFVRLGFSSELLLNEITDTMRNPTQKGDFWIGSGHSNLANNVYFILGNGNWSSGEYFGNRGVRPIIIIE